MLYLSTQGFNIRKVKVECRKQANLTKITKYYRENQRYLSVCILYYVYRAEVVVR